METVGLVFTVTVEEIVPEHPAKSVAVTENTVVAAGEQVAGLPDKPPDQT
jgi:hypothetical protein